MHLRFSPPILFALVLVGSIAARGTEGASAASDGAIARQHAPIVYQDVDMTGGIGGRADRWAAFNFDGDWVATNNWDHLATYAANAAVYYSVVQTRTHYFVLYGIFHPRDWTQSVAPPGASENEHENDMEGILAVIRKDGTAFGRLEGMIVVAHTDFDTLTPPGSALTGQPHTSGAEVIDGTLVMRAHDGVVRAVLAQEAHGHGIKNLSGDFTEAGGDGIIYFPRRAPSDWAQCSAPGVRCEGYRLQPLFSSLWKRQLQQPNGGTMYVSWGKFRGDDSDDCGDGCTFSNCCHTDSADAPWGWRDGGFSIISPSDGLPKGLMALDPARLTYNSFGNLGTFARKYTKNKYITDLANRYYEQTMPSGWPAELTLKDLTDSLLWPGIAPFGPSGICGTYVFGNQDGTCRLEGWVSIRPQHSVFGSNTQHVPCVTEADCLVVGYVASPYLETCAEQAAFDETCEFPNVLSDCQTLSGIAGLQNCSCQAEVAAPASRRCCVYEQDVEFCD